MLAIAVEQLVMADEDAPRRGPLEPRVQEPSRQADRFWKLVPAVGDDFPEAMLFRFVFAKDRNGLLAGQLQQFGDRCGRLNLEALQATRLEAEPVTCPDRHAAEARPVDLRPEVAELEYVLYREHAARIVQPLPKCLAQFLNLGRLMPPHNRVVGQIGQKIRDLGSRQSLMIDHAGNPHRLQRQLRTLTRQIEQADGLHSVAEEIDPQGLIVIVGEDVHDAAADGTIARLFNPLQTRKPLLDEPGEQFLHRMLRASPEAERIGRQNVRPGHRLHQGLDRRDNGQVRTDARTQQVAHSQPFAGDFTAGGSFAGQRFKGREDLHGCVDDLHVVAGFIRLLQVGGDEQVRAIELFGQQRGDDRRRRSPQSLSRTDPPALAQPSNQLLKDLIFGDSTNHHFTKCMIMESR